MGRPCPACGHDNRADARFCGRCATVIAPAWTCAACERSNPPDNRFCDGCGQAAPGAEPPPEQAREVRAFTPADVVEKLLGARTLSGERKQVTVLFADLTGSMDLAERTDPEAFRQIMDRFYALLCEGVHRLEGTVVQFTGDGIMALFGAPIAHEDHASRAAYAALHLGDSLADYAAELRRERGLNFSVRMGLNSGEVVVGAIGDDLQVEYTAIGHTVGLAQRMESLAEPGRPYVTEHTAALLSGFFELADLGVFEVKGVKEPLTVYALDGVGRARSRLDLSRARGFSRFVGRDEEVAVLESAMHRALEGHGQVVGVVGEPGVGKSRLCHEFAERCRANGMTVYYASGHAHTQNVPFYAALEMMRAYFEIDEHDAEQTARERIAGRLLLLDPTFADELPLVFEFLGVPDPERPAGAADPEARQRRLLSFVRRLVHANSRREPGVSLLEDLHWIDGGSEVFLEALVDALPGTRSLVIVNFRPEYRAEWMGVTNYQQLPLVPLGAEAISELLRGLLGEHPSLDGLTEEIRRRTGGNPFFIEELVQTLIEDGTLAGERGALELVRPFDRVTVPPTVHAVLAARIDRLDQRDKELLHAAAVLGQEFGEPVLERVAELSEPDLAAALRALVAAEFLYERALYPEAEYAFKHPLTREVAYGTQLAGQRAALHAGVARAIADLYPDKLDERAALLAHHWEAAGDRLEALRWHARAAGWAGVNALGESLAHWRRVRELSGEVEETPETIGLGMGARLWMLQFGWRLGIAEEEAAQLYEEGSDLARRAGDDATLALLMMTYSATVGVTGRMEEVVENVREAAVLAERAGVPAVHMATLPFQTYVLYVTGRLRESLETADRAIALAGDDPALGRGLGLVSPYAWCWLARGFLQRELGHVREAAQALERAGALAREHGDVETQGWTQLNWVLHARVSGRVEGVVARARESAEFAERVGSAFSRVFGQYVLGLALFLDGDHRPAIEAVERALAMSAESRTAREATPFFLSTLALARLGAGDVDGACAAAREGVDYGRVHHLQLGQIYCENALAETLVAAGALDEARAAVEEGLALVAETGGRAEEPGLHERLADIVLVEGDPDGHERHLREAANLYAEIGATGHAERVAARLGRLSATA